MGQVFWQVDAFAEEPFAGNPAGVMILDRPPRQASCRTSPPR